MFQRILVCSDGSHNAVAAAHMAAELAAQNKSKLTLVSVFEPPAVTGYGAMTGLIAIDPKVLREMAEYAHREVEKRTLPTIEDTGIHCEVLRAVGNPAAEILHEAKTMGADLVVMGSRGLGGFKSLLLGSVSDHVLHHAHCPVLIVRQGS